MFRHFLPLLAGLMAVLLARAEDKPATPGDDFQELVWMDGQRIGTARYSVAALDEDGLLLRATQILELNVRRYGTLVRLRKEESTSETRDGKVLALGMKQGQAGGKQMVLEGSREGNLMHIRVDDGRIVRQIPWPGEVLGLRQQQRLFQERKIQPGDRFDFHRYESTYNTVLKVTATVQDREDVKIGNARLSLTRVEFQPEKRVVQGQTLSPGRSLVWVDEQGVIRRRQIEMDGLGTLILERGAPGQSGPVATAVDIGARSLIPLDRTIYRPYQTQSVAYRFSVRDEEDPASLLVNDDHQEVKNVSTGRFDLLVHPVRSGATGAAPTPGPEYLSSSFFIDHDSQQIKELAQRIASDETDPWNRARKIERWVKHNLRNDNSAPLVPASQIARQLKGDCRHHGFLTAALARSVGIPSRTAIGLLYVNRGGPRLGFHMWTEVFIDGKWLGLDSTLGQGGVSACHVKVTQHHWMDVASLTPLLPVQRILGKVRVEVLRDS